MEHILFYIILIIEYTTSSQTIFPSWMLHILNTATLPIEDDFEEVPYSKEEHNNSNFLCSYLLNEGKIISSIFCFKILI